MAAVTPADLPLPAFLDPLLAYLSDNLPEPIYSFFITLLSHLLALTTALYALFLSLLSTHPLQWDAHTVVPPLIALLTSYLAIVSLYRTTSWMFRTTLWFVKWGTLLGGIVATASWLLFQQDGNALAGGGLVAGLGSLALNMMNGDGRNAAGGKSKSRLRKPKPWDSFESHREWQYQEDGRYAEGGAVQDVLGSIMDAAGKAVRDNSWWEVAKGLVMPEDESAESGRATTKTR
ncbi:hypothetical protein B0H11DRAFT_1986397 [Mycena galericulata]|nr:hypothetical protein B0H11DRAFT_1986397 [Mycena galericulata]